MISPQELGKNVAEAQDRIIEQRHKDKEDLEGMREVLFGESGSGKIAKPPQLRRRTPIVLVTLAAAACLTLVLSITLLNNEPKEHSAPELSGRWVSAPANGEKTIDFPDGSKVVLHPGAQARIVSAKPAQGYLLVEFGAANFDINHQENTQWRVDVGPYEVQIKGTSFFASWTPEQKVFTLKLLDGDVALRGPLVRNWQKVSTGETFKAWLDESRVEFSGAVKEVEANAPPVEPTTSDLDTETSDAVSNLKSNLPKSLGWRTFNREGRFEDVFRAAQSMGWSRAQRSTRATDLLALGDACRFLGKFDLAEETYGRVRKRFPHVAAASTAAFALGKVAFDQRRQYKQASKWLNLYLKEQPRGALAKEALGRLIEARNRAGNISGAKSAAQDYLSRFPGGPHAPIAKQILGNSQ